MRVHRSGSSRRLTSGFAVLITAGAGLAVSSTAFADTPASNLQFIIVSDDIRKDTTTVARPGADPGSAPAAPAAAPAPAPAGGSDVGGHSNNGHGNNADGVDSSNPGQGVGGPTGAVDPSGTVDDEAGGGGALPSQETESGTTVNGNGNGNNGNGNAGGSKKNK